MTRLGRRQALFLLACLALAPACGGGGGGGGTTGGGPAGPVITSFSPTAEAAGATIQISGLNFNPTAGLNTVRFNGVSASVQSATATDLVATVPAGATTGAISVQTSNGTGTSSSSFTVLTSSSTPGVSWTTRLTGPRNSPRGLAWNGTRFVCVGGSTQVSTDLLRWDERAVTSL